MSPIDWDVVERAKAPVFTDEQIKAAAAAVNALPARGGDPNELDTLWKRPKKMPGIDKVDFRDIVKKPLKLADLMASNKTLARDRLLWHVQHPGQARNPSAFTTAPMVLNDKQGLVILDGHHRLASVQLLGRSSWTCWLLPSK